MKFTAAASYLLVATAAIAVVSTEATSLRGKSLFQSDILMKAFDEPAATITGLPRRLEEDGGDGDDNENAENDDAAQENDDAAEEEEADENDDEVEEESDDYTFYDDEALQNCEEGDEDCEKAAEYAAYDDEYLANCGDDDEDCNEAATYITAKQKKEDEANSEWNMKNISEQYNSMSKSSKIWTAVLAVWFVLLAVGTCFFCCRKKRSTQVSSSGKSGSTRKSLRQSLMGGGSRKKGSSYAEGEESGDEQHRGGSKFRLFGGRKGNKNKRRSSKATVVE